MALRARNNTLGLQISSPLLDRLYQRSTELQLLCLPQTRKVALYSIGPVPHLRLTRVGAAERDRETNEVKWRGSTEMDCDVSGKTWQDLLDSSTADLDIWSSCLRNQMTWTSSGSKADFNKAVEKSSGKVLGNHFHLEPVLIKKDALWDSMPPPSVYPKDEGGKALWLDSDSVAIALIKIDLAPESFPLDPSYWEITEKLTEEFAIQLLHLHSKQSHLSKMGMITEERNEIIEILFNQIRQIMTKLSVVYRVIDNEAGYLRQTWEDLIHEHNPEQPCRANIIKQLNLLLKELDGDLSGDAELEIPKQLEWYQNKLAQYCFQPKENEVWLRQRIMPLWEDTVSRFKPAPEMKKQIKNLLDKLEQSFHVGSNKELTSKIDNIPNSIKHKWINLAYNVRNMPKVDLLKEYFYILEEVSEQIPDKKNTVENLICLRNLALYLENLEEELGKYVDKYQSHAPTEQALLH